MIQPRRPVRAAGSTEEAAVRECDALFARVAVSATVRERAVAIILADSLARRDLVRVFPGRFAEQGDMIKRRNASIRRLLADDAAVAQYDANVAALEERRSRGEAIHPAAGDVPNES